MPPVTPPYGILWYAGESHVKSASAFYNGNYDGGLNILASTYIKTEQEHIL